MFKKIIILGIFAGIIASLFPNKLESYYGMAKREYMEFNARNRIETAIQIVEPIKISIIAYKRKHNRWPTYFGQLDIKNEKGFKGSFINDIEIVGQGNIYIRFQQGGFSPLLSNKDLILESIRSKGGQKWQCNTTHEYLGNPAPTKIVPQYC